MGGIWVLRGEFGVGMERRGVRLVLREDNGMMYFLMVEGRGGLEVYGVGRLDLIRLGSVGERLPLLHPREPFRRVVSSLLHFLPDHQLV